MPPEEIERLRESLIGLGENVVEIDTKLKLHVEGAAEHRKNMKAVCDSIMVMQNRLLEEMMGIKSLCAARGVNHKLLEQHLESHREDDKEFKNLLRDKSFGFFVTIISGIVGVFIGEILEMKEELLVLLKLINDDARIIKDNMLDIDIKMMQIQAKMNDIEDNYRKLTLKIARIDDDKSCGIDEMPEV